METPKLIKDFMSEAVNSPFIIGFGGAIAGVLTSGKMSIWQRISMVIVGGLCAGYAAPFIQYLFGIENQAGSNFVAFIMGMVGMGLTAAIVKLVEDIKKDPKSFLNHLRKWRK